MITRVRANKDSFRSVDFTPGFNVVVADRTKESKQKDSRNGLGKSTLIEILDFAMGGKGEALRPLAGWEFTIGMRLAGRAIDVTRAVAEPKKLLLGGQVEGLGIGKRVSTGIQIGEADWNEFLGAAMFGIPARGELGKWSPKYRMLIGYFVRRGKDAYLSPFVNHVGKQQPWDQQVANAFLLGLAWEDAQAREGLREKDKGLAALKRAAKSGVVEGWSGTLGELEAERVRLEERAKVEGVALRTFKVHPQYRDLEARASDLTATIHGLNNENISDLNLLSHYRSSIQEHVEPPADDVIQLYEEAGTVLPELVRRRLEEVKEFHTQLVGNRRKFLAAEVDRLQAGVQEREARIRVITEERASLLAILNEHGALDEYTRMQQAHLGSLAAVRDLDARIQNVRQVEAGKSELKIEVERLYQRASQDYAEREPTRRKAISSFNGHSQALFSEPGNLVIEVTHSGFKFDVEIQRARSAGISNMKVFCYDLTLAQLWAKREPSPGMLVHDSLIFDGVDERQTAGALQRAAATSAADGFQYICTINSDMVPHREFVPGFEFDSYVRLKLTDATPEGCLLGVRF